MYIHKNTSTIQCDFHQDSYTAMNEIKQKINHGTSVCIKAKYAEELSNKADSLGDCRQYDEQKEDCKYCRMITDLHRKTAELIILARRLS